MRKLGFPILFSSDLKIKIANLTDLETKFKKKFEVIGLNEMAEILYVLYSFQLIL